jgi:endonuclease/exonuclease/phosphatase family metal-dependent hydrolase
MRTPVLVAVVACFVCVCPPVAVGAQPVGLRVLHWNVLHSGSGTDRVLNRARQVSWIVRHAPDIVTLNEVTASAADDYRARIAAATKQTWHLHHVAAVRDSDGNAILARYPMVAKGGRLLTRARSVTQATIEVAGTSVNVFATHLESGGEREARAEQARLLVPYLASFPAPHIVNGDFNAGPDRDEIQPLLAAYVDAWAQAFVSGTAVAYLDNPPSRYTRTRGTRIDYILTSPEIRIDGCEIPDLRDFSNPAVQTRIRTSDDRGVRPSDHNLVVCTCNVKVKS